MFTPIPLLSKLPAVICMHAASGIALHTQLTQGAQISCRDVGLHGLYANHTLLWFTDRNAGSELQAAASGELAPADSCEMPSSGSVGYDFGKLMELTPEERVGHEYCSGSVVARSVHERHESGANTWWHESRGAACCCMQHGKLSCPSDTVVSHTSVTLTSRFGDTVWSAIRHRRAHACNGLCCLQAFSNDRSIY